MSFPGVSVVKNPPATAPDLVLVPRWGISPVEGNDNNSLFLPGESYAQRSLAGYIQPTGSQRAGNDLATKQQLLFIKWITKKDLLYKTGNSTQYAVMAYVGKESEK